MDIMQLLEQDYQKPRPMKKKIEEIKISFRPTGMEQDYNTIEEWQSNGEVANTQETRTDLLKNKINEIIALLNN